MSLSRGPPRAQVERVSEAHMQRLETRPRAVRIALAIVVLAAAGMTVPAHAQTFSVLYEFTGGTDGAYPFAGLIRDPRGNLYGTTPLGGLPGSCVGNGCGVVFKLDGDGNQTVLYSFDFIESGWEEPGWDGAHPYGTLVRDAQGNLYGTTSLGVVGPAISSPSSRTSALPAEWCSGWIETGRRPCSTTSSGNPTTGSMSRLAWSGTSAATCTASPPGVAVGDSESCSRWTSTAMRPSCTTSAAGPTGPTRKRA